MSQELTEKIKKQVDQALNDTVDKVDVKLSESDDKETKEESLVSESLNMPVNTVKMLAYATGVIPMVGWLSSLLVLLLERDVRVKLHAYHGLAVFGGFDVLMLLINQLSILGFLAQILFLARFILWLFIMVKVSEGNNWLVPYVGPWAKKQVEIISKGKKV